METPHNDKVARIEGMRRTILEAISKRPMTTNELRKLVDYEAHSIFGWLSKLYKQHKKITKTVRQVRKTHTTSREALWFFEDDIDECCKCANSGPAKISGEVLRIINEHKEPIKSEDIAKKLDSGLTHRQIAGACHHLFTKKRIAKNVAKEMTPVSRDGTGKKTHYQTVVRTYWRPL